MSDYTKTTDFAAKDALTTGNANKVIKGTEIETEFDNIATAIATKYDSASDLPAATTSAAGALEIATQAEAEALTLDTKIITPHTLNDVLVENAGMLGDIQALADPGEDRVLAWDDSAGAVVNASLGDALQMDASAVIDVAVTAPLAIASDAVELDITSLTNIEGNALEATDEFIVDDGGAPKAIAYQDAGLKVNTAISTVKTFADADMNQVWQLSGSTDRQWDFDTGVGVIGNFIILIQTGTGSIDLSGGSATVNTAVGDFTRTQDSVVVGLCTAANTWTFYGDMASA